MTNPEHSTETVGIRSADTTCERGSCDAAEERRLARLEAHRPECRAEIEGLAEAVRGAVVANAGAESTGAIDFEQHERQLELWRVIHRYLHATPYRDREDRKRSEQWRDALARIRDLEEGELLAWVQLQAEVASNLEKGIPDMRPRKPGPTFLVMLEYVANRKRKALAILKWARAAEAEGCYVVDAAFHAETKRILAHYGIREFDEAGAVIPTDDPLCRI